jgi:hypothetical protein
MADQERPGQEGEGDELGPGSKSYAELSDQANDRGQDGDGDKITRFSEQHALDPAERKDLEREWSLDTTTGEYKAEPELGENMDDLPKPVRAPRRFFN